MPSSTEFISFFFLRSHTFTYLGKFRYVHVPRSVPKASNVPKYLHVLALSVHMYLLSLQVFWPCIIAPKLWIRYSGVRYLDPDCKRTQYNAEDSWISEEIVDINKKISCQNYWSGNQHLRSEKNEWHSLMLFGGHIGSPLKLFYLHSLLTISALLSTFIL